MESAKKMVDLVNQRKKYFAEQRAKAKRNKPMTQTQLKTYMMNYLKNQGTWKLTQLKKLSFEEVKEEFDKLVKQTNTPKRLKEDKDDEAKDDESTKKLERGESRWQGKECIQVLIRMILKMQMRLEKPEESTNRITELYLILSFSYRKTPIVIQNGNSKKRISIGKDGVVRVLSPVTAAEIQAVEKERKAKNICLDGYSLNSFTPSTSQPIFLKQKFLAVFADEGNVTAKGYTDRKKKRDSLYQQQEAGKQEKNQMGLLTMDDGIVNWGEHTEVEETNHALMAISSSNELSEAQILAYTQAVKKLEAQLVTSQKQQLSLNEKLTFQANEIDEKDEKLKRYRK
ncbi:hypothetical protein Tco_0163618 [Tanacetum coccineum]